MSCGCRIPTFSKSGTNCVNYICCGCSEHKNSESSENKSEHGKIYFRVTDNGIDNEEVEFDPTKGDLHIHLVSDECRAE
ncbi:MAG: hypothetical protein LBO69_05420 [Ignavibacteria bacterium]|jgi:hypothetical protein|nr:hypothetical protein [Ignavibacteria bacterium]